MNYSTLLIQSVEISFCYHHIENKFSLLRSKKFLKSITEYSITYVCDKLIRNDKRPVKVEDLKLIVHEGNFYAIIDESVWKIDEIAFELLKMCDGKRTYENIIDELVKKTNLSVEDVEIGVKTIFNDLTRQKFIIWID